MLYCSRTPFGMPGTKGGYPRSIAILEELQKATFVDRQRIALLCDISAIESEIVLRYLRKRSLKEEDIKWLEDKIKMQESAVNMIPDPSVSEMYKSALTGLSELLEDVKTKGVALRSAEMKRNIKENKFIFGDRMEWPRARFWAFSSFLILPESMIPPIFPNSEKAVRNIADRRRGKIRIFHSRELGKGSTTNVSSVFTSIVMLLHKKKAEISPKGKTPKPMYKPIVLSVRGAEDGDTARNSKLTTLIYSFSMAQMTSLFGFVRSIPAQREIYWRHETPETPASSPWRDEQDERRHAVKTAYLFIDHVLIYRTSLSLVGAETPIFRSLRHMTKSIEDDRQMYLHRHEQLRWS